MKYLNLSKIRPKNLQKLSANNDQEVKKMQKKTSYRQNILSYVKEKYDTDPEYPWLRTPDAAVLRHKGNQKWYGLIMNIGKDRIGLKGEEHTDILNVKCDPLMTGSLLMIKGILPAYHMNKKNWVTVLLDGTADIEQVISLLDMSYLLTKGSSCSKRTDNKPKDWLIPANPKIYDLEEGFSHDGTLLWKQSSGIRQGDNVYIYMGAPYSCILYRCSVTEDNVPYSYEGEKITIHKAMRLKLEQRFKPDILDLPKLRECGVYSVRCARSVPAQLHDLLKIVCGKEKTQK